MGKSNTFQLTHHTNNNTNCEITLDGGGIMNLYLDGKHILYAGPRPDGGQAYTHPCIPNFNIAKDLPNHGPARKELWTKINENTISWEMKEISGIYPVGIKATRQFQLSEKSITVTTIIENIGESELPTNIAEHNYFVCLKDKVKDIKINGVLFDKKAQQANAKFSPWQDTNNLEIPEIGTLQFNTTAYQAFAQWSQPEAPFACIEPIEIMPPKPEDFMRKTPKIKPGERKTFSYTIKLM
jgi:galactose mutarotase-like enzyme